MIYYYDIFLPTSSFSLCVCLSGDLVILKNCNGNDPIVIV